MKKRFLGTVFFVAIAAVIGLCGVTGMASAYDTTIADWGVSYFSSDTTGLYWYDDVNNNIPNEKYKIDPNKPTVIYTHGWKPSGQSNLREGLSLKGESESAFKAKGFNYEYDAEYYRYYINKGYNVGVFFWNQLADNEADESVTIPDFSVDQKIWVSKVNGHNIMTYATYDKVGANKGRITEVDDPTNPKESVAVIYGKALIEALGSDFNGKLHLVGHSMGGQLTLATAEYLCLQSDKGIIGKNLIPSRVTLIDPYLEAFIGYEATVTVDTTGKTYEYDASVGPVYTAQFVADATDTIRAHGIPIEGYIANANMVVKNYEMTAPFGLGEERSKIITAALKKNCVWVYANTMFSKYGGGFTPTHVMCVDFYFSSMYMNPVKSEEGLYVPCASMETEKLQSLIGLCFLQTAPKSVNPVYYDKSSYSLIDFATMKAYNDTDPRGILTGRLELSGATGRKITAVLINAEGETVSETSVDMAGYYYFNDLPAGDYVIKVKAGNEEIAQIESVKVSSSVSVPVINETHEVEVPEGVDILLYAILGAVVLMVVIIVAVSVYAGMKASKKKKNAF